MLTVILVIGIVAAFLIGFILGCYYRTRVFKEEATLMAWNLHANIDGLSEDPDADEMTIGELKTMLHAYVQALYPTE